MKKIIILFCVILLVGCGNKEINLSFDNIKDNIENLSIDSKLLFENNDYYSQEKLEAKYDIDVSCMNEIIAYMSVNAASADMYIVILPKDKQKAKEEINKIFDVYDSTFKNYYPLEQAKIENRLEKEYGKYLIYIVSDNNELVYNTIINSKEK